MIKFLTYLSRSFLTTWIAVVLGFLVLIGLLDSLANGDKLMSGDNAFRDTFVYIFYRSPIIFDRIFVFTLIVATLLVFVKLIRNHELVALLGFGLSVPKQIMLLTPVTLLCSLASITIINFTMPPAVQALQAWGVGEYKNKTISPDNPLWMKDNDKIVLAQGRPGMNDLTDIVLFQQDSDGHPLTEIHADQATYDGNGWVLKTNVKILDVANANGERRAAQPADNYRWETKKTPTNIARLAAEPRDLSLRDMNGFSQPGNSGSKPQFAYGFWFWHRLTRPLIAVLLLWVTVPIMQRTGRQDSGEKVLLIGLGFGFLFLIIDGMMATYAATGAMSIVRAILIPIILLLLLGSYLVLRTETLTLKRS